MDKYLTLLPNGVVKVQNATVGGNGAVDAGKLLALNAAGELDPSLLPSPRRFTTIITDPSVKTYPLGFVPGFNTEIVNYNGTMLTRNDDYIIDGSNIVFVDAFPLEGYSDELGESKFTVTAMPLLGSGPALTPLQERTLVYCVTYQSAVRGNIPFILEAPFTGNAISVKGIAYSAIGTDYSFNVQKQTPTGWVDVLSSDLVIEANKTEASVELLQGIYKGDKFCVSMPIKPVEDMGAVTIQVQIQAL